MGLPNINIAFKHKASNVIKRGKRGIVALVLKDSAKFDNPFFSIIDFKDIPENLSDENKKQIELSLIGNGISPNKVLVYVLPSEKENYNDALAYFETTKFNYLSIPFVTQEEVVKISEWITVLRDKKDLKVKAVLPNCAADHEGIINFTTKEIKVRDKIFKTSEYCSRIAGILASTPLNMSSTYAVLKEVTDVIHLSIDDANQAIDKGELILINDGEKCKIARAVNSLVTLDENKNDEYKKILIIDKNDMWHDDIKTTVQDYYLGKFSNDYDNKILLMTAIQTYNDQLTLQGLLDNSSKDYNKVFLNVDAQKKYLKSKGHLVEEMSEKDIKESNTKDKVFIATNLKWTDAMEDFDISVTI